VGRGSVALGMGMRRGCFRSDCQDVLGERVEEWVRRGYIGYECDAWWVKSWGGSFLEDEDREA